MAYYDSDYDKYEEIIETGVEGFGEVVNTFAKRNEDDYSIPPYSCSDTPPDDDGIEVIYTDLDDYDNGGEYEYSDGEYHKND